MTDENTAREWSSPAAGEPLPGPPRQDRDDSPGVQVEDEQDKARALESIATLAGGIAHDFNNLLQGILGNISLAKLFTPESGKASRYLENAEAVCQQATHLTSLLVCFANSDFLLQGDIHLTPHIHEAMAATLSDSDLTPAFNLAPDLWPAAIAPFHFRQVMEHLLANAKDAMPFGGFLLVSAENASRPEGQMSHPLPWGNYVKISVRDQGNGIPARDLPRIFDPYFSTKQRGAKKGTGLGLTLCHTIVHKHGGAIAVETEQGLGTTFHVLLPAVTHAHGEQTFSASRR